MARILITGGAGFIGSHVVDRFLADDHEVIVVDNLSTGVRENVSGAAYFHRIDVASRDCRDLIARERPDVIVHMAAQIDVRKSVSDPIFDAHTNIIGMLNVLEGVRAAGETSHCRVVFVSTGGAMYGEAHVPTPESTIPNPEAPYGVAKLASEHYLACHSRTFGLEAVTLRLGNVYGPRQNPKGEAGVVAIFSDCLRDERPMTIYGDGSQTRDYVYVADVAEAVHRASTCRLPRMGPVESRAFNVATGVGTSVADLADMMAAIAGQPLRVNYVGRRAGEIQASTMDVTKIRDGLGWEAAVGLSAGLRSTLEWAGVEVSTAANAMRSGAAPGWITREPLKKSV